MNRAGCHFQSRIWRSLRAWPHGVTIPGVPLRYTPGSYLAHLRRLRAHILEVMTRSEHNGLVFTNAHMRKMAIKWLANIGIEPDRNETDVIRSQKPTTTQTTAPQTSLEEAEDKGGDILDELVKVDDEEVVEPLTEEEEKELMEYMEPLASPNCWCRGFVLGMETRP